MRPVNEKLRVDLLEAGKREFMESGFRGASLKSIAASLGVTTGAIYRYYTDKEALFDGLVREPAQELVERYRTLQQTFAGRSLEEQLQKLPEVPDKEASSTTTLTHSSSSPAVPLEQSTSIIWIPWRKSKITPDGCWWIEWWKPAIPFAVWMMN